MQVNRLWSAAALALLLLVVSMPALPATADSTLPLVGDALYPPPRPRLSTYADDPAPNLYQPSAFLAGRVAVQIVFVESDGRYEPALNDWQPAQVSAVQQQVGLALEWWRARVPQAQVSFDLTSVIATTGYEPIQRGLVGESQWVADALLSLGISGSNYFDQAYAADEALRRSRNADWATTIFVVNSAGAPGGRFADGHFAYAYVNGPFMVLTSDAGPYGIHQFAQVVAHEFGHIFGALDQYAAAAVPCTQRSGYLGVLNSNSQANNCGTKYVCVMLDPLAAYTEGQVDQSALGQVGYYDSDGDTIPDPLDTLPMLQLAIEQPGGGGRPLVIGSAADQPFPSPAGDPATINTITQVEYRVDGGNWALLPAEDGVYDSASERIAATLPLYDGQHTIELQAVNSIGARSEIMRYSAAVRGVGADPGYRMVAPKLSNQVSIELELATPPATQVQVSASPSFAAGSWQPAEPLLRWELAAVDGEQAIYVRFRDAKGLESPTQRVLVTLDRVPPTGRALLISRAGTLWIDIQASDRTSAITEMQVLSGTDTGVWQPFKPQVPLTIQSASTYVRLRDAAGNVSAMLQATAVSPIWLPIAAG